MTNGFKKKKSMRGNVKCGAVYSLAEDRAALYPLPPERGDQATRSQDTKQMFPNVRFSFFSFAHVSTQHPGTRTMPQNGSFKSAIKPTFWLSVLFS